MPSVDPARLERVREAARAQTPNTDPAHDFSHVERVARNARHIASAEGADLDLVLPAAWLHELFNYPKNHPDSSRSGEVCAERAAAVLRDAGYPPALSAAVCECIRVHSFSRGLPAETLEARVLQDADRLDAIGAIGIARCFATCATMQRPFYSADDPFCAAREPDDKAWGVDHFYRKLLRIPERLHTDAARVMARERTAFMQGYLEQLAREIGADEGAP